MTNTGKPLVGIDAAKRASEVFVCEGIFDYFSLKQAGFTAICTLGTNLKEDHLQTLQKVNNVYIAYDMDQPGRDAGRKTTELLYPKAKLISLPESVKDVNELLQKKPDEFKTLIEEAAINSKDALELAIRDIDCVVDGDNAILIFETKAVPLIKKLDSVRQDVAINKISKLLKNYGIKKSSLQSYIKASALKEKSEDETEEGNKEREPRPIADFPGLVDIVATGDNGNPAFLVLTEENKLVIWHDHYLNDETRVPPDREALPWLLPRAEEVIKYFETDNDAQLYDDLHEYHRSISELPDDRLYDLLTTWDFHTHIFEKSNYSPYIWLFAHPERGKSRNGKGALNVARRGVHVESMRDAYLIRAANDLKVTLFFDVLDLMKKMEKTGTDDIFLMRYERGAKVPRVNFPDRGALRDTVYYEVFGPSIIATNRTIYGPMETRAVQVNMQPAIKNFTNEVTPELALPLKERLTAFRARWLKRELLEVEKPARGRLGDIMRPLYQVVKTIKPEREKIFKELINDLNKERKSKKSESMDANILKIIDDMSNKVEGTYVYIGNITKQINEIVTDDKKWSNTKTGIVLSAMGLKTQHTAYGNAYVYQTDEVLRLKIEFGLEEKVKEKETEEECCWVP